jgi:lipoprotein-anchoring transpeptidase ErfK/SrfK
MRILFLAMAALLAAPAPLPAVASASGPQVAAATVSAATNPPRETRREIRGPVDLSRIRVTRELPVTRWLPPGEFIWDAAAAAETRGGTAVVVVNLRARVLSVYVDGVEVGRSSILYGAPDKPTPTGTFRVLEKRRDHRSNLYDAPMPHMMRLTWDGVALHGSPRLADDLATNGCVGLPREFAAQLFDVVDVGDEVVIWSGTAA